MTNKEVAEAFDRLIIGWMGMSLQRGLFRSLEENLGVINDLKTLETYLKASLRLEPQSAVEDVKAAE